jgi:hypothetical protein
MKRTSFLLALALLASGCEPPVTTIDANGRSIQTFRSKLTRDRDGTLRIDDSRVQPTALRFPELEFGSLEGRVFETTFIIAGDEVTGTSQLLAFRDRPTLVALVENSTRWVGTTEDAKPSLTPADRDGLIVEQVTSERRNPNDDGRCRYRFDTPVAVTTDAQRYVLEVGQSLSITLHGATYRLSLETSEAVQEIRCAAVRSGLHLTLVYTLVRTSPPPR